MRLALLIILVTLNVAVHGQTIPNYRRAVVVSHLSGTNKTMLMRAGAPKHNSISRVICFKFKCRSVVGWKKTQQRNKFKGYKKPGIPRLKYLKNDSSREQPTQPIPIVRDTVQTVAATPSEPVRKDSLVSFVFNDVLFDLNSSHIKSSFTSQLDSVSNLIREHKNYRIEVIGHTDNSGTERANAKLSQNRAQAVATYLVSTGIDGDFVVAEGRGSSEPIADNTSAEGRAKNRRVEILLRFH
jgi:outer membrane protein OmpA-like peptidoglycan-associated protein